jgi:multimeric flavodoxin WrbA
MQERKVIKVLGISASLRNARHGAGSVMLVEEIKKIPDKDALIGFLQEQTKIRSDDFIAAGQNAGKPFDEIYATLRKAKGERGLSNSEASLVAAMWAAHIEGVDIEHVGLSEYYPMNGEAKNLDKLKEKLFSADAIILSSPVYFGDRGSPAQEFVEFLQKDSQLAEHFAGKVYGGVAVGAKRNGGQETLLIYQMLDMANLSMLSVGNSSETSSQYGGTVKAGDIGTAWKDDYGINTAMGTGARVARIASSFDRVGDYKLHGKVKVAIWLVQDEENHKGLSYIQDLVSSIGNPMVDIEVIDFTHEEIYRCIACDLCPIGVGDPEEYRCIINSKDDAFVKMHTKLISADAILLAAYSPVDKSDISSVYQRFIERTRYLRRDHYALSDRLVAPLVLSEVNSNQNLHIRMLTSLIRHHTVLHHPIAGMLQNDELINSGYVVEQLNNFCGKAVDAAIARLSQGSESQKIRYNPIGYEVSRARDVSDEESGNSRKYIDKRVSNYTKEQLNRISKRAK